MENENKKRVVVDVKQKWSKEGTKAWFHAGMIQHFDDFMGRMWSDKLTVEELQEKAGLQENEWNIKDTEEIAEKLRQGYDGTRVEILWKDFLDFDTGFIDIFYD